MGGGGGGGASLVRVRQSRNGKIDLLPLAVAGGGGGSSAILTYDIIHELHGIILGNQTRMRGYVELDMAYKKMA